MLLAKPWVDPTGTSISSPGTLLRKDLQALIRAMPSDCIRHFIEGMHAAFMFDADIKPILDRIKDAAKSLRAIDISSPLPSAGDGSDQTTVALGTEPTSNILAPFKRPVPVSKAATTMNRRASSVLRKLEKSGRRVDKTQRPAVAEFEDICQCFSRFKKRLTQWADKDYPAAEE
jgi:hypothetical protein